MERFDFGIGWTEGRDHIFAKTLEDECKARRLSFILIDGENIVGLTEDIKKDKLNIKLYLDMASETHNHRDKFTRFAYSVKDSGSRVVADPDDVKTAADKSITHFDLVRANVPVPFTVVIRNWEPTRRLTDEEKEGLGFPFIIKPALGYGQKGVKRIVNQRCHLKDIAEARKFNKGDNFLLQEMIEPMRLDDIPAWFRVFYLFGEVVPCWWNPTTHTYSQVSLRELNDHNLLPLIRITSEIARITRIDWFSCEIAIKKKSKKFLVIDYMNDQCSMSPQSEEKEGVPDDLIAHIAERIAEKTWQHIRGRFTLTHRAIWLSKIKVKDETA